MEDRTESLRLIALIRLVPVPFGVTNYLLSVTKAPFSSYAIGTLTYLVKVSINVWIGVSLQGVIN